MTAHFPDLGQRQCDILELCRQCGIFLISNLLHLGIFFILTGGLKEPEVQFVKNPFMESHRKAIQILLPRGSSDCSE
jgi:hypothetical protein